MALPGSMATAADLGSILFGLVLSVIETSITATALVTIGDYFDDHVKVSFPHPFENQVLICGKGYMGSPCILVVLYGYVMSSSHWKLY